MTLIPAIILFILILIFIFINVRPGIAQTSHRLIKSIIYAFTGLSYIFLFWSIIQHNRDFHLIIQRQWFYLNSTTSQLGFYFDNLSIFLAVTFFTILIIKSVCYVNNLIEVSKYSTLFTDNIVLLILFAGLLIITSDSLLIFLIAQIVLSVTIFYQYLYRRAPEDKFQNGSIYFISLILFDLLFLIGAMFIYASVKSFSLINILKAFENGTISPVVQTVSGFLFILALTGKSAQIPLHKWFVISSQLPDQDSRHDISIETLALSMILLLKLRPIFCESCLSFMIFFGFLSAFIATVAAITLKKPKHIFHYLLIAQGGLFLVAHGSGSVAASLHYIITFCFANLFLFLSAAFYTSGGPSSLKSGYKSPYFWLFLWGIISVSGLPLSTVYQGRAALLQNLLSAASANSFYWVYVSLFLIFTGLLTFAVFRFWNLILISKDADLTNRKIGVNARGYQIGLPLLFFFNIYYIFTFPNLNPLNIGNWLNQLLPVALTTQNQAGFDPLIAVGIIVPGFLGILLFLLIYKWKLIKTARLRKSFEVVENGINFITNLDTAAHGKIISLTQESSSRVRAAENFLVYRLPDNILLFVNNCRTKTALVNDNYNQFLQQQILKILPTQKVLSYLTRLAIHKNILITVIILILIMVIILASII